MIKSFSMFSESQFYSPVTLEGQSYYGSSG